MKKLLNISDFPNDDENLRVMEKYQKKYNFDGFEIIKFDLEKDSSKYRISYEIFSNVVGYIFRKI